MLVILLGTEEAALAARRAGLLDAYTESNTQAISDSEKFKEGYKKKSSKGTDIYYLNMSFCFIKKIQ